MEQKIFFFYHCRCCWY